SVEEMFAELEMIARERIGDVALRGLVLDILDENRDELLRLPAATRNHHAFVGGWLGHVLSVTRTCVMLADKSDSYYPDLKPRLDKGRVVAGGIVHDVGKIRETRADAHGGGYTVERKHAARGSA